MSRRTLPSEELKGNDDKEDAVAKLLFESKAFQILNDKIDKIGDAATKTMLKTVDLMDSLSKKMQEIEGRVNVAAKEAKDTKPANKALLALATPKMLSSPGISSGNSTPVGKKEVVSTPTSVNGKKDLKLTTTTTHLSTKKSSEPSSPLPSSPVSKAKGSNSFDVSEAVKIVKEPKPIQVSYKINLISEINAIVSTFLIDIKIFFIWTDEACIGLEKLKDSEYFGNKKYFDPQIIVTNGHTLEEKSKAVKLLNSETGEVKVTVHYVGSVYMTSMNLRLFPFDCQNLQLQLKPYKLPVEEVIFEQRASADSCIEHHVTHEWRLSGHCMKVYKTDPLTSSVGKEYSTVFITVLTQRKPNWFNANIFTPSCILLLLSWLVYSIDPTNIGNRNELALATLTALIANKYVVADQLPKVDYRTMVDVYLDGIFLLQALTTLSNAFVAHYQNVPPVGNYIFWKTSAVCVATATNICKKPPSFIFQPTQWLMTLYFDTLNLQFFMLQLVLSLGLHLWMGVTLYDHAMDVEKWIQDAEETMNPPDEDENEEEDGIDKTNEGNDFGVGGNGENVTVEGVVIPSGPGSGDNKLSLHPPHVGGGASSSTHPHSKSQRSSSSHNNNHHHNGRVQSRRSSFSIGTADSLISHSNILALKRWFPELVSKDESHFTNFGVSTLASFIGDRDKTALEEKAYLKKSRSLKKEIASEVGERAKLQLKTELFRKRLIALRNRVNDDSANAQSYEQELRIGAAVWLQSVWRSNRARKLYHRKKEELRQSILEGYARKIQRAYRLRKEMKQLANQANNQTATTSNKAVKRVVSSANQNVISMSPSSSSSVPSVTSQTSPVISRPGSSHRAPMYFPNTITREDSVSSRQSVVPSPPTASPTASKKIRQTPKALTKDNLKTIPSAMPHVPTRRFSVGSMGESDINR